MTSEENAVQTQTAASNLESMTPAMSEDFERIKVLIERVYPEDRRELLLRLIDDYRKGSREERDLKKARREAKRAADLYASIAKLPKSRENDVALHYALEEASHASRGYTSAVIAYQDLSKQEVDVAPVSP